MAKQDCRRVAASARSARQHKAWGVSPRINRRKELEPAERATAN